MSRPAFRLKLDSEQKKDFVARIEDEYDRGKKASFRADGLMMLVNGASEEEIIHQMDVSRATIQKWVQGLSDAQRKLLNGMALPPARRWFE